MRITRSIMPKFGSLMALGLAGATAGHAAAQGPAFSCDKVSKGSIEETICHDAGLSALDRKLAKVYKEASAKAANEHPPQLKTEQRGWAKGRDECWKTENVVGCVQNAYQRRIAELQARYHLLPGTGPVTYVCDGDPHNQIVATFYDTDPPTLIAERGDSTSLMYLDQSAGGAKYSGRNETFRERHGEAIVTWGHGAPEMRCAERK